RATWGPVGRRRDADTREQPADPTLFYKQPGYSPYASRNYAERLYFGDENPEAWSVDVGGGVANARSRGSRRGLHGTNISPQPTNVLKQEIKNEHRRPEVWRPLGSRRPASRGDHGLL